MKAVSLVSLVVGLLSFSPPAHAGEQYLVLGVIANSKPGKGVALVKQTASDKTLAVREGQKLPDGTEISSIHRKSVDFIVNGQKLTVDVGATTADATSAPMLYSANPSGGSGYSGVERQGSVTRVSAAVRDHIVKNDLSKVLMQAAAVPQYRNGILAGFSLHDIEPGSVYEQIGLKEGDMVTHINGQGLNDVANTIKLLKSLKDEPNASMNLIRNGQETTLSLVVQ